MALFGSTLREDLGPESDVDLLVDFEDDADPGLLDHIQMQQELGVLLGRKAGRIAKRALEERANGLFLRRS